MRPASCPEWVLCDLGSGSGPPTSVARAELRPASSMRTRRLSPDEPPAAGDRDDVAVDLGDGVVDVVHVRLDDRRRAPPRPPGTGTARSRTSSTVPSMVTAKWSSGRLSEPSKWKTLPVAASSSCSMRAPRPVNSMLTSGCTWTRNASTPRGARAASSRSLRSSSIATVSSLRTTPSPSQVGQVREMISRTPSVTFWRVISTSPSFEISAVNVFVRSWSSAPRSTFMTASRLRALAMSMKSMTMMPPMSRRRS